MFLIFLILFPFNPMPMKKILLSISLSVLFCSTLMAQQTRVEKLSAYTAKYSQEKAYVQTDRTWYLAGDTIWMKATVADAATGKPSTRSGVLYVELSQNRKIWKRLLLPLSLGFAHGDIPLPDTLSPGSWHLRAYTRWMRNAGEAFFFDKVVEIGGAPSNRLNASVSYARNAEGLIDRGTLKLTDHTGSPHKKTKVVYSFMLNNKKLDNKSGTTGDDGTMTFQIPKAKKGEAGALLTATMHFEDKKQMVRTFLVNLAADSTDIQFFPESGHIVAELPCRIAYKAIGADGLGRELSGKIIDGQGTVMTDMGESHLGMGSFYLNPLAGSTYKAEIVLADGTKVTKALPVADASGYGLAVNCGDSTKVDIKVMVSADRIGSGGLSLLLHRNGNPLWWANLGTAKALEKLEIPTDSLPSGLLTLTLFTAGDSAVCERLVLINHNKDRIKLSQQGLKKAYAPREKVSVKLKPSFGGKTAIGSYAVSATSLPAAPVDADKEGNILATMLIGSELKGYVEHPAQYLRRDSATRFHLENLLLTQGWRRIDWKLDTATKFPVETGLEISGKMTRNNKPVVGGNVVLYQGQGIPEVKSENTDSLGNFRFRLENAVDTATYLLLGKTESKKTVDIKADFIPSQKIGIQKEAPLETVNVDDRLLPIQQGRFAGSKKFSFNGINTLKEVSVLSKPKWWKNSIALEPERMRALGFYKVQSFEEEAFEGYDRLLNFLSDSLRYKVNWIPNPNFNADVINLLVFASTNSGKDQVIIYVNGLERHASFDIDALPMAMIDKVEFWLGQPYKGHMTGALLIRTRDRKEDWTMVRKVPLGTAYVRKAGFSRVHTFYVPRYGVQTKSNALDLRPTIYWAPHLVPDGNGEISLDYFCTDEEGECRMLIEGMDMEGHMLRQEFFYRQQGQP